ncbi:segregation and condensation protein A [Actinotignum urinale]|uniref:Segregation and condensation protein A n=1 Tax=Actinotignum urinale TaxID=190146 RepID=A0ABU5G7Y7_9ACTO|nr:ScpA family protein [Actinotignum urinale]MDY5133321.1 ScpA family protein [Actinotignum urinale]
MMNTQQQDTAPTPQFIVDLDVYSGPFSVLLDLIAKKSLDVTTVALAEVTDDFLAFIHEHEGFDISTMSEFLVVASTLLDMKAARLLPTEPKDDEDWELIEQRDFLFAKLLQYRAYKQVADDIRVRMEKESLSFGRDVPLEERFAKAVPKTRLNLTVEDLVMLVAQVYARSDAPRVGIAHLHHPLVNVPSQVTYIRDLLSKARGTTTFAELCATAPNTATVVSRFLAVLFLLRNKAIAIEQPQPFSPLILTATPAEEEGGIYGGEMGSYDGEMGSYDDEMGIDDEETGFHNAEMESYNEKTGVYDEETRN